jgi:hypothetical protein
MINKPRLRARPYEPFYVSPPKWSPPSFSAISSHHYRSAVKLIQYAQAECITQQFKTSFFIISAICLFHACLECYINEYIGLILFSFEEQDRKDTVKRFMSIQDKPLGRGKLNGYLDACGARDHFEATAVEDVVALCELRDRLYHHSAEMKPFNEYPQAAIVVLNKVGVPSMNSSWVSLVSHLEVGNWARKVTERFVERHCAITGWESPFSGQPPAWNSGL